jgi:CXXC-20-CXXC protein
MLSQKCPNCKYSISFRERFTLIYKFHGTCKLCNKDYMVKTDTMITSAAVLGAMTGIAGAAVLEFDSVTIFILCVFVVLIVQSLMNLFYSLIPVDNSENL